MVTRFQKVLAVVDRFVHEFFRMQRDETHGLHIHKYYRWGHWGRRCAIVNKDGRVINLGYSWTVRHHLNEKGELISRLPMRLWAEPTDRVLYGRAADEAWRKDPSSQVSFDGVFWG